LAGSEKRKGNTYIIFALVLIKGDTEEEVMRVSMANIEK
jgi:hypothetical protein